MSADYKESLFLPKTYFPMRAGLPQREPALRERWKKMDLFKRLRADSAGREKFILHDGPPYANGHLHIGHALNKILKDVINRSQQMLGKDANYVPGWDCHGLPIEWKIEEQYRAKGRDKDQVPVIEFRKECREFAEHWIGVQSEEFQRLGVLGDWENPYTTMAFRAEALTAAELMKFAMDGQLFRGSKPVMWSVVEKTALAEAEVEYHDHTSHTIWVKFPVVDGPDELKDAAVLIWTTTPWTIPANRAIAYSSNIGYSVYEATDAPEDNWVKPGERLIIADALAESVMQAARVAAYEKRQTVDPSKIRLCAHPFRGLDGANGFWDFDVPLLEADYVTDDAGTGFVHTAPGHGADDYNSFVNNRELFASVGLHEVPHTVAEDGAYYDHIPLLAGKTVFDHKGKEGSANKAVIELLTASGALAARGRLTHSYPHSWRSKAPLIFRNTAQWFISMGDDKGAEGLRAKALKAIDETRFVPPSGKTRLFGMIEQRPDWVISRQRAWGVPITVFVEKETGEVLRDERINERIVDAFSTEGADAWFADGAKARFLGNDYDPERYEQVTDILDVWFDSGSTHAFVLEQRPELAWPASLYLEGTDQHRGWFHSSLLESCGTRGRAPYNAVLTHGFTMDEEGRKMSKSLGNTTAPQDVIKQYGADILRLWVVTTDYTEDQRIGPHILQQQADNYRRLRNTLRFILGNLAGFDEQERLPLEEMPELERWVLHRLVELDALNRRCCNDFDFHTFIQALLNFCTVELSAFYLDVRKDALYCDAAGALRRRAARTVLDHLFSCLTAWLAPILCFTAEEAWLDRFDGVDGAAESVHLRRYPQVPAAWRDDALAAKWAQIRRVRRVVTGALEKERAEKRIGASLEAAPVIHVTKEMLAVIETVDMAEIGITSGATPTNAPAPDDAFRLPDIADVAVVPTPAVGDKCQRCWKVLPEVGTIEDQPDVCRRCADAVAKPRNAA